MCYNVTSATKEVPGYMIYHFLLNFFGSLTPNRRNFLSFFAFFVFGGGGYMDHGGFVHRVAFFVHSKSGFGFVGNKYETLK